MTNPTVVSGIQPTGKLHIGNYLGALRNFVELQESGQYRCFFMIVDEHSLTEDFDPKEKPAQIMNLAADFLAAGLDPNKSTLFIQSHVPEHTELAWIFSCLTPMGELSRMTQFKDKSGRQEKNINTGLFTYPVLMAADILIYKAHFVPVGDDQRQHLELTNTILKKFNGKFGKFFHEVEPLWTRTPRVMSLKDPARKMSKSEPNGCLFLDDDPAAIRQKISKAVAATNPLSEIGITSLNILHAEGDKKAVQHPQYKGAINLFKLLAEFNKSAASSLLEIGDYKYSEVKAALADSIAGHFADFREKKAELTARPDYLAKVLGHGSLAAREIAGATLREVKQKIGLL